VTSPWLTAAEAATYLKRGKRFVLREIKLGRLRGARVGGRGEVLTRAEWCDQWVEDQSVIVPVRRRMAAV
jgi:excisionase family DNA binding protein